MARALMIIGQCLTPLLMAVVPAPLRAQTASSARPIPPLTIDEQAVAQVDPLAVIDDDFARLADPALWQGLSVRRIGFRDGMTAWRLWRISNRARGDGPLWIVPHDNENASFAAAVDAVRSWGGVVIAVDSVARDSGYAGRLNDDTGTGAPIDPNRQFIDDRPVYATEMLRDRAAARRIVIALHTNAPGFDPALPACPDQPPRPAGSGAVSIGLCSDHLQPRPSISRAWPFDDDDTLVLAPYLAGGNPRGSYCRLGLEAADFNLVAERVGQSDGSLSNYAARHGLPYLNLETREGGNDPAGLGSARARLTAMIDAVMERCALIAGTDLRVPLPAPAPSKRPVKKRRR